MRCSGHLVCYGRGSGPLGKGSSSVVQTARKDVFVVAVSVRELTRRTALMLTLLINDGKRRRATVDGVVGLSVEGSEQNRGCLRSKSSTKTVQKVC